ncbi:protoporphyrinogen/coproporphyrinogen oxidase [Ferruginibacter sp.]
MESKKQHERIIILGAGPTGLGAAMQLNKLGHDNWILFEKSSSVGGLASSVKDDKGFTWDLGGHVQFSHYKEFDELMDSILPNGWLFHKRSAWIWMRDRFVPYPFQYNFNYLQKEEAQLCFETIPSSNAIATNDSDTIDLPFDEWITNSFGNGIANSFMLPYNEKIWAYPLHTLSSQWIGDRVAKLTKEHFANDFLQNGNRDWGANKEFRFPLFGGTGAIWNAVSSLLPNEKINYNHEMISVNTTEQKVKFSNGHEEHYDKLITTIPLDILIYNSDLLELRTTAKRLKHSSTLIIGIGIKGKVPGNLQSKSWIYFPESNCPFYRVTVFSNYSPNNVPNGEYWSIMAEVSAPDSKQINSNSLIEEVLQGLIETKLLETKSVIVSKWSCKLDYGYPTPTIDRDECLNSIFPSLSKLNIFSRGRFGAWKYEVSNQDHSYMQGVECVNSLLNEFEETTLLYPDTVNRI